MDDLLLTKPESTFKEVAGEVFLNATQNEALQFEIMRSLGYGNNLRAFDKAVQEACMKVTEFLELKAQQGY